LSRDPSKGSRSAAPFVLLGLAFFLTLLLQKSFLAQPDEGYTLNAAWQMWHGLKMYDDFRLFVAPGSGCAVFAVWAMFGGPSFLSARVLSLLLSFSSIVAVYLILARRGVRGAALAAAVAAWTVASAQHVLLNHNAFSSYAATWMLLALLRAQDRDRAGRGRLRDHALVGVAGGLVTLCLQTKGLALLAVASAVTLFAGRGLRGVRAAAVLVAAALAVVAPLLLVWRPSVLVREWFVVPLQGNYLGQTNGSLPLAVACVVVAGAMTAIALRLGDRLLIAVSVMQAALVASMLNNIDAQHAAVNSFPLAVFVPLALRQFAVRRQVAGAPPTPEKFSPTVMMAIIVATFGAFLATPVGRPFFKASTLYVDFIRHPSRNPFPQPRVAAAHAIYAGPFLPGFYFSLGKKNPYFVSESVVCNDDCRRRLLGQLEAVKPELAFLDYQLVQHLGYDENNPVDAYFRDRYVRCPNEDYAGLIVRAIDARWCP
jgi:hypothetical protein